MAPITIRPRRPARGRPALLALTALGAALAAAPGCRPAPAALAQGTAEIRLHPLPTAPDLRTLPFRPAQLFGWADDSTLALADADAGALVVQALSGAPRRVGRRGNGPGELQVPAAVVSDGRGGLAVADARTLRISRFDRDLRFVGAHPAPGIPLHLLAWEGDAVSAVWVPFGGGPVVGEVDLRTGDVRPRFHPFERSADLAEAAQGAAGPSPFVAAAAGADGGYFLGSGARYRIVRFAADGAPAGSFGRDLPVERPSPAEVRARTAEVDRVLARAGGASAASREMLLEQMRALPKPFFAASSFAVDGRGRLWVATERGDGARTELDVFTPAGEHLATVTVRDRVKRIALRGALLAVLVERRGGELDGEEGVDAYRVEG